MAVHAARDPSRPTGTVTALCDRDGERTMITDRGANIALSPDDLAIAWFRRGGHLHVSGYPLLAAPPEQPRGRRCSWQLIDVDRTSGNLIRRQPTRR